MTKFIFMSRNAQLFEDVKFVVGDLARDFVFRNEYIDIPLGVIGIDQDHIFDLVQSTTNQDNGGIYCANFIELASARIYYRID